MGISSQPSSLLTVEAITAARTINASDSGKRFVVTSLVANYAITLPSPIKGISFEFLGAGASFYATLVFAGTMQVSNGAVLPAGSWSNVNIAEVASSIRIWSDGSAWYLQTLAGRLLIEQGILSDDYQAASIGQVVKKDQNYNAVGSYCFCYGAANSPGVIKGGSLLIAAEAGGGNTGVVLSGTWRCCGYASGTVPGSQTLYQRIA